MIRYCQRHGKRRCKIWVTAYIKEHYNVMPAELAALEQLEFEGDELNITGAIKLLSYYFGIPLAEIHRKFVLPPTLSSQTTVRDSGKHMMLNWGK